LTESDNTPQTQATIIYEGIRSGIFSGHLKPGARLRVDKLRELREALNRLSANGLVEKQDNRGFCVPEISSEELQEIYQSRSWLEDHLVLISACKSRFLLQFCEQLHDQTDRYRQAAVSIAPRRKSKDEHQEIVDLVIKRDADKAVKKLQSHYERTQSIILQGDL